MPGRHAAARTGLGRARVRLPGAEGAMACGWEGRAAGRRGASQRAQGDDNDLRAKRAEAWAAQSVIIGPIGEHRPRSLSRAWGGGEGERGGFVAEPRRTRRLWVGRPPQLGGQKEEAAAAVVEAMVNPEILDAG